MPTARALWTIVLATWTGQAVARPEGNKPHLREACRQAVAGTYLKTYDERERLKTYMRSLGDQLEELDRALAKVRAEAAATAKSAASKSFDIALATRQEELSSAQRTLEARIDEARALRRGAATELDRHVAEEKRLRTAIEKVFTFTRTEDKPDGGYPISMQYRSDCPKYRHLCALPAKDLDALLKIESDGAPIAECQRYAGLSRLR